MALAPALAQLDSGFLAGLGTGRSWMLSGPLATSVSVYREGAGTSLVLHEQSLMLHAAQHRDSWTAARRTRGVWPTGTSNGCRLTRDQCGHIERRPPVQARHVEPESEDVTVPALIKMGSRSALRDALRPTA